MASRSSRLAVCVHLLTFSEAVSVRYSPLEHGAEYQPRFETTRTAVLVFRRGNDVLSGPSLSWPTRGCVGVPVRLLVMQAARAEVAARAWAVDSTGANFGRRPVDNLRRFSWAGYSRSPLRCRLVS